MRQKEKETLQLSKISYPLGRLFYIQFFKMYYLNYTIFNRFWQRYIKD
nr:MAG TPA: hypothetical protein [Caudoviricetes sp.]